MWCSSEFCSFSYFSSTTTSAVLQILFILMPTTQLSILLPISNLFPLFLLELLLVFNFLIPFFPIWMKFPGWATATMWNLTFSHLSLKNTSQLSYLFHGSPVNINILGLNINNKLSWKPHITTVAKAASKKLRVLFKLQDFSFRTVTPTI